MVSSYIGEGMTAVTPYLHIDGAAQAISFYEKVLGAQVRFKMDGPGGAVMHAELLIGGALFMLGEAMPDMGMKSPKALGGSATGLFVYVPDVEKTLKDAVAAGATLVQDVETMFWGDRTARIVDPFGHQWTIATHVEDVSPAEMQRRQEEWMKKNAAQ